MGCATSQADVISQLSPMFENKISTVVSLACQLNQMMNEVVSGDFEALVVRPGETFHCETMKEESDGSGGGVQATSDGAETSQTVLCTSELGLTKRIQLGTGEKETKLVIKAKVILESFLDTKD